MLHELVNELIELFHESVLTVDDICSQIEVQLDSEHEKNLALSYLRKNGFPV